MVTSALFAKYLLCALLLKEPHASSVWQGRAAPKTFLPAKLVPTLVRKETGLGWILLRAFRVKVS